jgi:hypothetical protein
MNERLTDQEIDSIVMRVEHLNEETPADIHDELVEAGAKAQLAKLSKISDEKLIEILACFHCSGSCKGNINKNSKEQVVCYEQMKHVKPLLSQILPVIEAQKIKAVKEAKKEILKKIEVSFGWDIDNPEVIGFGCTAEAWQALKGE